MPLTFVVGDPTLTRAQTLAFGHNAAGRTELGAFETQLMNRFPVPFSMYTRRTRQQKQKPGSLWLYGDSMPRLLFLTIRASSVGATRLRYVQAVMMTIARDYRLLGIESLAIAPLGNPAEQNEINDILNMWLSKSSLPVVAYTGYQAGTQAKEPLE